MPSIHASADRFIPIPPDRIYSYIADHRHHHPHFLPPAFSYLEVEEGGVGSGTVISYRVTLGGREQEARARIEEPEPGRVMTETILGTDMVTTFTVDPEMLGCRVTIATEWRRDGVRGFVERLLAPPMLRRLYVDELARLEAYGRQQSTIEMAPQTLPS
jgi:hypothetical protein